MKLRSFDPKYLNSIYLPMGTTWLLGECMEAKGRQELWEQRKPESLRALKDQAMIQSAESSNRIEGVEVSSDRLKPLVLGRTKPRSRPEEEIMGYRRALEIIHSKHRNLEMNPKVIAQLHKLAQKGAGDAGLWKTKNNEIIEFDHFGQRSVRFVPLNAKDTNSAMENLCESYQNEMNFLKLPVLVISSLFILDFLCIHPFRDGNGRVSRLLTLLSFYQSGFNVGKYVSLERIVEENKESYYEALKTSSQGWHEQKHDSLPWINFCLSILRQAYKEMAENIEQHCHLNSGKGEVVEVAILKQVGSFSLREIQQQCPNISVQMIKKVLNDLKKNKQVILFGRGRGARWRVK